MIIRRRLALGTRMLLALVLVILAGFPLYWMLNTAITPNEDLFGGRQALVPDFSRVFVVFQALTDSTPFLSWMGNSAIVAVGTTVLSLVIALLAAYAMSRYRFFGKGAIGFGFFATQMLPEALLVVPLYSLFTALGLLNQLYGLVLVNTAFAMPVAMWVLKAAIDSVPYEIEEAARLEGCGPLRVLILIVTPIIVPSIAAAAVVCFFDGWGEYLFATTFMQERSSWLASTGLASFIGEFSTPLDLVFSAAFLFTLPAVVFFAIMQRRMVSGLASGSVKG